MSKSLSNFAYSHDVTMDPKYGSRMYTGPTGSTTGYSSLYGGNLSLDPSIRAMQDQYLNQMAGATGGYTSSIDQIMKNYQGNQSAFMQAAVDPLKQAGSQAIGAAAQGYGLRGLGGSSFASDSLAGISSDIGRQIGDVQSQALNQQLGAQAGLAGQKLGAQQQLAGAFDQASQQRLSQELAALGLGQQEIGQLMNSFENWQNRRLETQRGLTQTHQAANQAFEGWFGGSTGKLSGMGTG